MDKQGVDEHAKEQTKGGRQDKVAMSKALGQAFLSHQVRQLEAGAGHGVPKRGRYARRGGGPTHTDRVITSRSTPKESALSSQAKDGDSEQTGPPVTNTKIIVDASVLVHAVDRVRKWCIADNGVNVVIPLEVLNTLDLLKKGNSAVSAQARAASRLLEEQVGANTRISVQDDHAITEWTTLSFTDGDSPKDAPQWVRGTLGCAAWEKDHTLDQEVMIAVISKLSTSSESTAKWHNRADGRMIQEWAERLRIPVLPIQERKKGESYKEHGQQGITWQSTNEIQHNPIQDRSPGQARRRSGRSSSGSFTGPLVDKPPAVMPTTGIRLLARGEMLAP